MKYLIKDTNYNKMYKPKMIGMILTGKQEIGEYVAIEYNGEILYFLTSEVEEIKEQIKANKTNVVNSIKVLWADDKKREYVKQVLRIKSGLKQRTIKEDLDSIIYYYNRLIELYLLSCKQIIDSRLNYILKPVIVEILKSNLELRDRKDAENMLSWSL